MDHVAIMKKSSGFTDKILNGQKEIESRWYSVKYNPWNRIKKGDVVYIKNSGELVKIKTKVNRVVQFDALTPEKARKILNKYSDDIGIEKEKVSEFYKKVRYKKYCILIFLKNPHKIKPFKINKKGFGVMSAWIVVDDILKIKKQYFSRCKLRRKSNRTICIDEKYNKRLITEHCRLKNFTTGMNNKNLFNKVKDLKLPLGKYALFGSAPLGVRGLKECSDVDLIVTEDLWQKYKDKPGWKYKITEKGVEHIEVDDGDIEIWHDWRPWYQDVTLFIDSAEMINGLPFVKLEYLIEWKKKFGREKDLKDLKAVEKFLNCRLN